ncbi:MAG: thioredoxin-like domain-containing protein [Bacteroidales bacterium]|nr:thioredoxin-like domain-containing protein [Bacteroidales bacterium]HOI31217.1 thioredoxin-like domain-containing protein [Bacteroidales bacterium]
MRHWCVSGFSFLFLTTLLVFPQIQLLGQHQITGTITDYANRDIFLEAYKGELLIPVDTVKTNEQGTFSFDAPLESGLYRLSLSAGPSLQLVVEKSAVQFVWNNYQQNRQIQFINSPGNQIWNDYLLLRDETFFLQDLLKPVIRDYKKETPFYRLAVKEFDSLQQQLENKVGKWIHQYPENLATRFVRTDMRPAIDLSGSFKSQRENLKQHFFDHTDFSDTLLIRSNILTRKMIDFLSLFQAEEESMQAIQFEFIKGLDMLFEKAAVEPKMYVFVLDYLIEGFAQLGLPAVTDYISSLPHFDQVCMETETYMEIEQIVGPYRSTLLGEPAPDLLPQDIDGNPFGWERISKPNTLIVFWSINCPHCIELMPELKAFADQHPEFEVISVVLSPDNNVLRDFLEQENLNWIHLSDGLGWESPMVKEYNIFGTPSIFVLDEEKKIASKPSGIAELIEIVSMKKN